MLYEVITGFGIGPIPAEKLLLIQGCVLSLGAIFALWLGKGRQLLSSGRGVKGALSDIADGFHAVRSDGKLWAMTALMFGVGIFVIGAFLVVLPIVNRDVYGFGPDGIRVV